MMKPVAPSVPADSKKPEDKKAWDDFYGECDRYNDSLKPCMGNGYSMF